MAAPQIQEVSIKVANKVLLTFDQAIDDSVNVPLTCFSINYGRVPLKSWEYYGTAAVVLTLGNSITYKDKIEVNYQPPEEMHQALRAPVSDNASAVTIRRNAVRAFFKVPALNQLAPDEGNWNSMSNLGVSNAKGKDFGPEGGGDWEDPCGNSIDGSNRPGGNGAAGGASGGYQYPIRQRPNPRTATPDDFVLAYGLKEAIQLSNLDDADATQPNTDKIWMAIQDACALIDNYIIQASRGGKLLISSNRRRTALIIARYYLDTVRRREDIKNDYEMAITELDRARNTQDNVVRPDPPWWQDPCNPWSSGGVRSHRIPQYYNGVSGKGLSGWWVDSAAEEASDFRENSINSQNNNDQPNGNAGVSDSSRTSPNSPTDNGGDTNSDI